MDGQAGGESGGGGRGRTDGAVLKRRGESGGEGDWKKQRRSGNPQDDGHGASWDLGKMQSLENLLERRGDGGGSARSEGQLGLNPQPSTPNPQPSTLNPEL